VQLETPEVSTIDDRIKRILAKLEQVDRQGLKCFGSESHRFRLAPPLTETAVSAFETRHGIRLPEDYRCFLLEAGGSGAGPYYGILPLDRALDLAKTNSGRVSDDYLAEPFLLFPGMPEDEDWHETLQISRDEEFQGSIAIVHQGCSYYCLLVISGPFRGRVVYICEDGGTPYFVRTPDFLSWYEWWLDELLWGYDASWFGVGLPGREEDIVKVLKTDGTSASRRSEALRTLGRIPALSESTVIVVSRMLLDRSADIRCKAVHLMGKHVGQSAIADIRPLLHDANASVRKAALAALKDLPATVWQSDARAALRDPDHDVVFYAMCRLKDAGLLLRLDLVPLFESADPQVRRHAAWASASVKDEACMPPDELLHDPDSRVRRYAILGQEGEQGREKVPVLIAMLEHETSIELIDCIIGVLGKLKDRRAVPALIELTRHNDGFLRQNAARSLGKLGDKRAIPALRALLSDHEKPSRRNADNTGGMSSTYSVADIAKEALNHFAWWLR
jgi:HEAT repeat protein